MNDIDQARADLVERLAAHKTLGSAPREQLEWLAAHGTVQHFAAGEVVADTSTAIFNLYVVLSGHMAIRVDRGGGSRKAMEWFAGDVTGKLPYSRMGAPPGVTSAEEPTELLMVPNDDFPEMIARCHDVTAILVHVMLDRARRFTRGDLHDEKMASLGRLAAGLAHELNNPASAAVRSAQELVGCLLEVEMASLALGSVNLTRENLDALSQVRATIGARANVPLSPIERADREDALASWLAKHGLREEVAETLAGTGLTVEDLEPLARSLDPQSLGLALIAVGANGRAARITAEVEAAAERVHTLVTAIKGFTYMDQSPAKRPVDVKRGLTDTLTILGGKARTRSVTITLDVAGDLPIIEGFGGELNQVWQNLIDNAIDAAPEGGHVRVKAVSRDGKVVVCVTDDGPGVPEAIRDQIFEPFFTTKPQGQGTGLGLDIVRRLVHQHEGAIELVSRPGCTEFRVTLPVH